MAAYEQGERIWVIEQRGRAIWMHAGTQGARGRHDVEELATVERARERLDAIVAEQVAKGFRLIDAERSVDAPLYGQTRPAALTIGTRAGLDVAELCAAMREDLAAFPTVRALVQRFASVASTPCVWNLHHLAFAISENGAHVTLEAIFGKGEGPNLDAYEQDGYRASVDLAPLERDDLADRVDIDVFADDLRHAPMQKVIGAFLSALSDLASFQAVCESRVASVEVERLP